MTKHRANGFQASLGDHLSPLVALEARAATKHTCKITECSKCMHNCNAMIMVGQCLQTCAADCEKTQCIWLTSTYTDHGVVKADVSHQTS